MPDRIDDPFLFDSGAYYGSEAVQMMDERQECAYRRLLSRQWEEGSIPADPRRIAALLGSGIRTYTPDDVTGPEATLGAPLEGSLWAGLQGCFEPCSDDPSRLVNPRMEADREKWLAKKRGWAEAGRKGGKKSGKTRRKKPPLKPPLKGDSSNPSTQAQAPLEAVSPSLSPSSSSSSEESSSDPVEDVEVAKRGMTLLAGGKDPLGVVKVDYGTVYSWLEQYRKACPKVDAGRALLDDLHQVAVAGHGLKNGAYIWTMLEPLIAEGECGNLKEMREPAWQKEKRKRAEKETAPRLKVFTPGEDPYAMTEELADA